MSRSADSHSVPGSGLHAPDQPLREDIHLLGDLLGETLRAQEGVGLLAMVERVRALAKSGRAGNGGDFAALGDLLATRPPAEALPVARAFAFFLTLANIAEQHHRIRRRRDYQRAEGTRPQPGSCDEVFGRLIAGGTAPDLLFETVVRARVELVITAHPTEVVRRTLMQKHIRIAELLARRDRPDLTAAERQETVDGIRREIVAAWETDEVQREKPTPLDEVRGGLFVFEQTLWDALPRYVRALDEALARHTGRGLPTGIVPIRFGSWIGGDRDGNPNVTADVTGNACLLSRWIACSLYLTEIDTLRSELSMAAGSPELVARTGQSREPYRALLREVREDLEATRKTIEAALAAPDGWKRWSAPLEAVADLLDPLLLCQRALVETGNGILAGGRLLDLIRRVTCFGLTLVRLDVRQDSARHTALLDAVTRATGRGSYAAWDEERRCEFLLVALASAEPLIAPGLALGSDEREVLETFQALAAIHPESLGAYVITMAGNPSDVLAVMLLQKAAGIARPLRVVPLFETIADLRRAGATMSRLFSFPLVREAIGGRQEVMVGYSDSAKDAGRFAAAWHLYTAQEELVDAARAAQVELTLFHGRGGSVGRGGGPTYLAVSSQPPGSVDGRLRVTVQGEMVQAEFGLAGIALRTLEVYTTATLNATLAPPADPRPEWRRLIETMADAAARGYRTVVYETPEFVDYFRYATPEVELGELNIGSRPARRAGGKSGVESLRAIPWQFAWTQNRLLLPSWLGIDDAIDAGLARDAGLLAEMHRQWPFFSSTIDLIEMVLAKSEAQIAACYDRLLVPEALRPVGEALQRRLTLSIDRVLRVAEHARLLEANSVLRRSIDVRNPYVDPINLVQVEVLRRMRAGDASLRDAFVVTVNGIAAGMRNTG